LGSPELLSRHGLELFLSFSRSVPGAVKPKFLNGKAA
jgi:hypothetical protein